MAVITVPGMWLTGDHASRPSSDIGTGSLYSCTTHGLIYQWSGSAWSSFWYSPANAAITPTLSYGSNATHVTQFSTAGSSNAVARADHAHAGVAQITSSSSNTLQRGTVNFRPGDGIAFGVTDSDGEATLDTITIHNTRAAGSGSAGGSSTADVIVLAPTSDAQISSANATTNYDTQEPIYITNAWATSSTTRMLLFTFNIASLASKTIGSAILYLKVIDTSPGGLPAFFQARKILRAYVAAEVTWNVYSSGNNWTTAGAQSEGNDVSADYWGSIHGEVDEQFLPFDITRMVQAAVDAAETTLRIIVGSNATNGNNSVGFASLGNATAGNRPSLRVVCD